MKRLNYFLTGFLIAGVTIGGLNINPVVGHAATQAAAVKQNDYQNRPDKAAIEYVVKNKLMWLYPDGNFRPDQTITQADLIAGLSNVKSLSQGIAVPELPANHWAKAYYERAKKDGILMDVQIAPTKVLNREEAARLMTNAWKNLRTRYQKVPQYFIAYAVDSQWILEKAGKFPNGVSTSKYDSLGTVTRGEQAIALYNLHRDLLGINDAEKVALQFHNSLKVSGSTLTGTIPSVKGYDIRLLVRMKDGKALTFTSGKLSFNTLNASYAEFTIKRSGESIPLSWYYYQKFPSIERVNSRW